MYILYWLYAFKLEDKYYSFALTKLAETLDPDLLRYVPSANGKGTVES